MKKEAKFRDDFVIPCLEADPAIEYDLIETGTVASDVPDIAYTLQRLPKSDCHPVQGHHGWLELKVAKILPSGKLNLQHWTRGQRAWAHRRSHMGAPVSTLIGIEVQGIIESIALVAGALSKDVPVRPTLEELDALSINRWSAGKCCGFVKWL